MSSRRKRAATPMRDTPVDEVEAQSQDIASLETTPPPTASTREVIRVSTKRKRAATLRKDALADVAGIESANIAGMELQIHERLATLGDETNAAQYEYVKDCVEAAVAGHAYSYLIGTKLGDFVASNPQLDNTIKAGPSRIAMGFEHIVSTARKERNRRDPKLKAIEASWPGESARQYVARGAINFVERLCKLAKYGEPLELVKVHLNIVQIDQALKWRLRSTEGYHPFHREATYKPTEKQLRSYGELPLKYQEILRIMKLELAFFELETPLFIGPDGLVTRDRIGALEYTNLGDFTLRTTSHLPKKLRLEHHQLRDFLCTSEELEEIYPPGSAPGSQLEDQASVEQDDVVQDSIEPEANGLLHSEQGAEDDGQPDTKRPRITSSAGIPEPETHPDAMLLETSRSSTPSSHVDAQGEDLPSTSSTAGLTPLATGEIAPVELLPPSAHAASTDISRPATPCPDVDESLLVVQQRHRSDTPDGNDVGPGEQAHDDPQVSTSIHETPSLQMDHLPDTVSVIDGSQLSYLEAVVARELQSEVGLTKRWTSIEDFLAEDMESHIDHIMTETLAFQSSARKAKGRKKQPAALPKRIDRMHSVLNEREWATAWTPNEDVLGASTASQDDAQIWVYTATSWAATPVSERQYDRPVLVVDLVTSWDAEGMREKILRRLQEQPPAAQFQANAFPLKAPSSKHALSASQTSISVPVAAVLDRYRNEQVPLSKRDWPTTVYSIPNVGDLDQPPMPEFLLESEWSLLRSACSWSRKWMRSYAVPTGYENFSSSLTHGADRGCRLSTRGAWSDFVTNGLGTPWVRCLAGSQLYSVVTNLSIADDQTLGNLSLDWTPPSGSTCCVPLRPGFTLIMPTLNTTAYAHLTVQDAFTDEGIVWGQSHVLDILENIQQVLSRNDQPGGSADFNRLVSSQIRRHLRGLELYIGHCVAEGKWQHLSRDDDDLAAFAAAFQHKLKEVTLLVSCTCVPFAEDEIDAEHAGTSRCGDQCPCQLRWQECSPWCGGHSGPMVSEQCVRLHPMPDQEIWKLWSGQQPSQEQDVAAAPGSPGSLAETTLDSVIEGSIASTVKGRKRS